MATKIIDRFRQFLDQRAQQISKVGRFVGMTVFPLLTIGVACVDFVELFAHPHVTVSTSGGPAAAGLHGKVEAVTVELTDPGIVDRIVATLSDQVNLALIIIAFSYFIWSDRSGGRSSNRSALKWVCTLVAVVGVIFLLTPPVIGFVTAAYFDVEIPEYQFGVGQLLLISALTLLLIHATKNRLEWVGEHDRANKLDEKIKDVV